MSEHLGRQGEEELRPICERMAEPNCGLAATQDLLNAPSTSAFVFDRRLHVTTSDQGEGAKIVNRYNNNLASLRPADAIREQLHQDDIYGAILGCQACGGCISVVKDPTFNSDPGEPAGLARLIPGRTWNSPS